MTNKMNFSYGCHGAEMVFKIDAPEIDKICPECNSKMTLIDGRGLYNSGTHSFLAECKECGNKEKFSDNDFWQMCIGLAKNEKRCKK